MTTERLNILAAAAALREFTASELAAYTGANPSTVRQVLQREQQRRKLFLHADTPRRSRSGGRPAVLWRLPPEQADLILTEISEEESKISQLRGTTADTLDSVGWPADQAERSYTLLASAEEAVARSYESADTNERRAFARIAMNLLCAADPNPHREQGQSSGTEWWEPKANVSHRVDITAPAPIESISPVSIAAQLQPHSRQQPGSEYELIRRAQLVASFASLSARRAEELPIDASDLMRAADAIGAGSEILPARQTLVWLKIFVDSSIESGNLPPVAILTKSEHSPSELFPADQPSMWQKVRAPDELAHRGYALWVESWAETLWLRRLIPGVVMSHDDSPESNDALTSVMGDASYSAARRAIVIASRTEDLQVAARVSLGGGVFFPIRETVDGLTPIVSRAVTQALSATLEIAVSRLMTSDLYGHWMEMRLSARILGFANAIGDIPVKYSELELAQQAITAFDEAIRTYSHLGSSQRDAARALADLLESLNSQLRKLGGSQQVMAALEELLQFQRKLIKLHSTASYRERYLSSMHNLDVTHRRETGEAMEWAYELVKSGEPRQLSGPS
jgi:hypothetical protein